MQENMQENTQEKTPENEVENDLIPRLGECRRYPPSQTEDEDDDGNLVGGYEFPIVPDTCGCHECRRKTPGRGEFCGNCKCWHHRDDMDVLVDKDSASPEKAP